MVLNLKNYRQPTLPEIVTELIDPGLSRQVILVKDAVIDVLLIKTVAVPDAEYQILPALCPGGLVTVKRALPGESSAIDDTS